MYRQTFVVCAAFVAALASAAPADEVWLTDADYHEMHIVIAPQAFPSEIRAAELFQEYWTRCTGHIPTLGPEPVRDAVNVWIGAACSPFVDDLRLHTLGGDGMMIRSYDLSWRKNMRDHTGLQRSLHYQERKHLVIAGGEPDGTVRAVEVFFDQYVCAAQSTRPTPACGPPKTIPPIDFLYVPPPEPPQSGLIVLEGEAVK